MLLHSPRNFGGTRTRPANKLVCMLGIGPQAVSILVDLNSAIANCDIIVPTVDELSGCTTAQEVGYRACDGHGDIDVRDQFPDRIVKVEVQE